MAQDIAQARKNPYLDVLSSPGAAAFSTAAAIARMPMSMIGIGTVLMVQTLYGSYGMAGRVAAVLGLAQALVSPQLARWVDRRGQRVILLPSLGVTALGLAGLVVAGVLHAPEPVLWLFAAVAGASQGSYGSMVRARWSHLLRDPRRLHTAYSLESAVDELVYIAGPILATTLATAIAAPSGLVVAAVATVAGGLWFCSLRGTEPPVRPAPADGAPRRSALLVPGMPVLLVAFVSTGTIFGAAEVATVAFAEEEGAKAMSGVVLAVFAAGSLLAGLAYGARHWISPATRRFTIGMAALAAGVSLFFLANSLWALAAVMFVTGMAIAPTIITGNALVQELMEPHQLTEGLAWVGTAIGIGASVGASLAGVRIDDAGAHAGFLVAMVASWVAAVVTLAAGRTLRRRR